jgi:hypothetical protein
MGSRLAPAILGTMRSKWGSRRSRRSPFRRSRSTATLDRVNPGTAHHAGKFVGPHEHRIFKGARRNLPQERPEKWARAIIDAWKMAKS